MSAQSDLFKIVSRMMGNTKLQKLLHYQTKDALEKPNVPPEDAIKLLGSNIRVTPKLPIEDTVKAYIIVSFDAFTPNMTNPEFRDNIITFDVICHMDCWSMDNYSLRPYLIMGELDGMFNESKLNGIGRVEFIGANQLLLSEELAGFTLAYKVINDV